MSSTASLVTVILAWALVLAVVAVGVRVFGERTA
jgi:hypothetical protein